MSEDDEQGFPEPPAVGDEAATLLGSLERQRATLAWKCAGLTGDNLRVSVGASSITLGGLLKHLAYMEDLNFTKNVAGQDLPAPWDQVDWSTARGWEWRSAADNTPDELYALWSDAVSRSRSAVIGAMAEGGLDHETTTASGKAESLRRLLVDMIEEYARHTGHADLIRESIDGRVGEDPPGRPYPYRLA